MNQPPGGGGYPPGNPYGGGGGQPPPPPQQQGYGPPMQPGFGQQQPFAITPITPPGARMGLWIGIGGAVVAMVVTVVVVLVNVMGVGLGSASQGNSVCARAVRCCELVGAKSASAANCKNLGKLGVPDSVCEATLNSMKDVARSQGKTCR